MEKDATFIGKSRVSLDLLRNFHESFKEVSSNKAQSRVAEPLRQKLGFLAQNIFKSSEFFGVNDLPSELREFFAKKANFCKDQELENAKGEEYINLQNLSLETKLELFTQISLQICPELASLVSSSSTKKGLLQVKYAGTLKSWHNKFIILDISRKSLLIFKETRGPSPEKELKLEGYAVRWVGKSKNKYCFSLLSQNVKPSCVLLGGEHESSVREWHEELKKVMNLQEELIQSRIRVPSNQSNSEDENLEDFNELSDNARYEGFKSDNEAGNSQKLPRKLAKNRTLNSDNEEISDPELVGGSLKPAISRKKGRFARKPESFSPFEVLGRENVEKTRVSEELFHSMVGNSGNFPGFQGNFPTNPANFPKNSANFAINEQEDEQSEENPSESLDNCASAWSFLESLKSRRSDFPPLLDSVFGKCNRQELLNELGFHLVFSEKSVRVLQNDANPFEFKAFVTLAHDCWEILACFLENSRLRNWNAAVLSHRVCAKIESLNSFLVRETREVPGFLSRNREFFYSRTVVARENAFVVIDKSQDFATFSQENSWKIKGNLAYSVLAALPSARNRKTLGKTSKSQEMCREFLLINHVEIDNQGFFLTKAQNAAISRHFLENFKNLDNFLAQRTFFAETKTAKSEILTNFPFLEEKPAVFEEFTEFCEVLPENEKFPVGNPEKSLGNPENPKKSLGNPKKSLVIPEKSMGNRQNSEIIAELLENPDNFLENREKPLEFRAELLENPTKLPSKPLGLQHSARLLEMLRSNEHTFQAIGHVFLRNPRKLSPDELHFQAIDPIRGHYALNSDWSRAKDGGLLFSNREMLAAQGKVLGFLIKKLGSNLLQGKSIINISLPVDLFDTKSFLERIAYSYTYAPYFLEPLDEKLVEKPLNIEKTPEKVQKLHENFANATRFREKPNFSPGDFQHRAGLLEIYQVLCFVLSSMHMSVGQRKPFNPILGETFQGWIKGCPIYCEQISHHPPISAFLMVGKGYKIQGSFEIAASMHPNSVTGKQLGLGKVSFFKEGGEVYKEIHFTFPACVVSGLAFGARVVNFEGKIYVIDAKERLALDLSLNPDRKSLITGMLSRAKTPSDYFKGFVYELKEPAIEKMIKSLANKRFSGINLKEDLANPQEISVCEGIWHEYLEVKGKKLWEFKDFQAFSLDYEEKPLPSDCLYREDLIVWRENDVENAQIMKEKLENFQRADRKLREKFHGKKH